jgi:MSHA pilin protein MshB
MRRQSGFTIIEIIIVVIILGLLAATALPRFLDVVDDAEDASLEGVAGGFATAVGLVRGQWEVAGRPSGNVAPANTNYTFVTVDNIQVSVDGSTVYGANSGSRGYPTAAYPLTDAPANDSRSSGMTSQRCAEVFRLIMQNPPAIVAFVDASTNSQLAANKYVTRVGTGATAAVCYYFQTNGLTTTPAAPTTLDGTVPQNYFSYNPATGEVRAQRLKP